MRAASGVEDIPFESAKDVGSIQYRLHPLDVGWDIKAERSSVEIRHSRDLRVSYADANGDRRVISGPIRTVVGCLRKAGYAIDVRPMEG